MHTRSQTDHSAGGWRISPLPWSATRPRVQALLIIAAWLAAGVATSLFRFRFGSLPDDQATAAHFVRQLSATLPCLLLWALATPVLARVVVAFPMHGSRRWRHLAAHVPIGALAIVVLFLIEQGARSLAGAPTGVPPRRMLAVAVLLEFAMYAAAVGILDAMAHSAAARRREQEVADLQARQLELENDVRDAQLDALRRKLDPHFLFNALQNVTALMREDVVTAERMLARLGDFLRMALRLELTAEVPLGDELEVTRAYLDLERLRFQDRLSVTIDVANDLRSAMVPNLMLQPLVENAIVHGVGRVRRRAELRIDARRENGSLLISVHDNGPGFRWDASGVPSSGVGLGVLQGRLDRHYAGRADCACRNSAEGGAVVEIRLPYRVSSRPTGAVA